MWGEGVGRCGGGERVWGGVGVGRGCGEVWGWGEGVGRCGGGERVWGGVGVGRGCGEVWGWGEGVGRCGGGRGCREGSEGTGSSTVSTV